MSENEAAHVVVQSHYRGSFALPLTVLFGATILTNACLLFLVQPLASKLILPWFGGSAAVWVTCMLFFQAGLLLGYLYAHTLATRLSLRTQAIVHSSLLAVSLAGLPILPNMNWQPGPGEDPTWKVLGVLATSVGLPYLLLSATSPLLQSWYAHTARGRLPYRYFALSNTGSLLALLSYPIFIEPYLTGRQQAWFWSGAFVLAVLLTGLTAFSSAFGLESASATRDPGVTAQEPQTGFATIVLWLSFAACPSALLLAITNLLTQNVAPMPLLWVLPLSIYLLTFILCFESDHWYRRIVFLPLLVPALGILTATLGPLQNDVITLLVPLCAGCLFVCCMACHGELARLRPESARLTTFYLCLAAGGALGGLFVALIAPHLFKANFENPIAFVSCAVLVLTVLFGGRRLWQPRMWGLALWCGGVALTIVLICGVSFQTWRSVRNASFLGRNFYGSLRVEELLDHKRPYRQLSHGSIIHGIQFRNLPLRAQPISYYGRNSGIGLTWRTLANAGPLRMGVVGLGTGTLAAYGRAGDTLRFYDINPLVIEIARNQFTYLADSPAHIDIVLGDARLSLARESSQQLDILAVDAFSGDAVPIHLLTREAFQIYFGHLKPDGVLAIHVSNHYLDLPPIVKLNAEAMGKEAWLVENDNDEMKQIFTSTWVLVTSRESFFSSALVKGKSQKIDVPLHVHAWTDDFSNLWQVLKFKSDDQE